MNDTMNSMTSSADPSTSRALVRSSSSALRRGALALSFALASLSSAFALHQAVPAPQDPGASEDAPAAARETTMLQLFDGAILWGSIVGHDAQTLHVERLDTGGRLRLPWNQLAPALAESLQDRFGYIDRSGEEIMIEAERLFLNDGRDVVGVILNQTEDAFWIKTATSTYPVPKMQIKAPPTRVKVSALEIYSRDELYKSEVAKLDVNSPEAHWDMGGYCERIYDFAHAIEHFQAARAIDPEFRKNELSAALERNTSKVALQTQIDALREIDMLRARGRFDDAVAKADAFVASFEDSPLRVDAAKKKAQVIKARDAKLKERVSEAWLRWLPRLLDQKARSPELTIEAALDYLDQGLRNDLVENVTKEVAKTVTREATPDLVRRYWAERQPGRWRSATYGQGTWLLGEGEARKGLDKQEASTKELSETDAARKELEDRVKRYLQNQELLRKSAGGSQSEGEDREGFWLEFQSSSKSLWMLAYHVEHSGEYMLREPSFTNCPDCGGRGVREIVNIRGQLNAGNAQGGQRVTGGQVNLAKCPTCFHMGVFRRVWFR
jgi:hypothetical protein